MEIRREVEGVRLRPRSVVGVGQPAGATCDFAAAMEALFKAPARMEGDDDADKMVRDARFTLWDKDLLSDWTRSLNSKSLDELLQQGARLAELVKTYGEKDTDAKKNFANWKAVLLKRTGDAYLELASRPDQFTAEKLAALIAASHVPEEDRGQIIDKLRDNLPSRFADSLEDPFVKADQILTNVEEIAKRHPDVYNRLDFKLAEQWRRRFRRVRIQLEGGKDRPRTSDDRRPKVRAHDTAARRVRSCHVLAQAS